MNNNPSNFNSSQITVSVDPNFMPGDSVSANKAILTVGNVSNPNNLPVELQLCETGTTTPHKTATFTNGQTTITGNTGPSGTYSADFKNSGATTGTVIGFSTVNPNVFNQANFSFTGSYQSHYDISVNTVVDNQPGDNISQNQALINVTQAGTAVSYSPVQLTLTGAAYFTDGSQNRTSTTDASGNVRAFFTDNNPIGEVVTLCVNINSQSSSKNFTFGPLPSPYKVTITTVIDNSYANSYATNIANVNATYNGKPCYKYGIQLNLTGSAVFNDEKQNSTLVITDITGNCNNIKFIDSNRGGESVRLSATLLSGHPVPIESKEFHFKSY